MKADRTRSGWRKWRVCDIQDEQYNYNFAKLFEWFDRGMRDEVARAWSFELDRELGLNPEPFLRTWTETRKEADPYSTAPKGLRPIYYDEALAEAERFGTSISWGGFHGWPEARIMFEIDWRRSLEEIEQSFSYWLRHKARIPGPALGNLKRDAGNKSDYNAWFRDLAIYRLWNAGWTQKMAIARLEWTTEKLRLTKSKKGVCWQMSAQHWSRCTEQARTRIKQREAQLKEYASLPGQRFKDLLGKLP